MKAQRIRLGSGKIRWRGQVMVESRKLSKTFPTQKQALEWMLRQKEAGPTNAKLTFGDLLARYLDEVTPLHRGFKNEAARIGYFQKVLPVSKKLKDVSGDDISDFIAMRLDRVKEASVKRDMNLLKAIFNQGIRWEWLVKNPCKNLRTLRDAPPRERVLSSVEIKSALNALDYDPASPPYPMRSQVAVAFLLALETGMRAGEITGLEWSRVFLDKKYVRLEKTKNGYAREVPLSAKAVKLLKSMQGIDSVQVFLLTSQSLCALFYKARKSIGLDDFTFHDTRHTAATRIASLVRDGKLDVFQFCKIFGWRKIDQALAYVNPKASEIADIL